MFLTYSILLIIFIHFICLICLISVRQYDNFSMIKQLVLKIFQNYLKENIFVIL